MKTVWVAEVASVDGGEIVALYANRDDALEWLKSERPQELKVMETQNDFERKRGSKWLWKVGEIEENSDGSAHFDTELGTYQILKRDIL